MVKLYGLAVREGGPNASPFVVRSIAALKHKGIQFEIESLTFTQVQDRIPKLTNGQHAKVPVLELDDGRVIFESSKIADYLDETYPSKPLYPNGKALVNFLENYIFNPALFKMIILDLVNGLEGENQKYFRESREKLFGCTLEQFAGNKEDNKEEFNQFLYPLRSALNKTPFFEGDQPTYSDYIVYGTFKTLQGASRTLFDEVVTNHKDQSLKTWFDKIDSQS